jgi:hypothetical protein
MLVQTILLTKIANNIYGFTNFANFYAAFWIEYTYCACKTSQK